MDSEPKETHEASITVRCSKSLLSTLKGMAEDDKRTLSNYLRLVLESHADEKRADAAEDRAA